MIALTHPSALRLFRQAVQTRAQVVREMRMPPAGPHAWKVNDSCTLISEGEFLCHDCEEPFPSSYVFLFRRYNGTHRLLRVWDTSFSPPVDVTLSFRHPHMDNTGNVCMGDTEDLVSALMIGFNPGSAYGGYGAVAKFYSQHEHNCEFVDSCQCSDCGAFGDCSWLDGVDAYVCGNCADENYFTCENCSSQNRIGARYRADGQDICEDCIEEYYSRCEDCDELFHMDDLMYPDVDDSGSYYCSYCCNERFDRCSNHGEHFLRDGGSCTKCREEEEELAEELEEETIQETIEENHEQNPEA